MSTFPESGSDSSFPQLVKKKKGFGIFSNSTNPSVRISLAEGRSNNYTAYMQSKLLPQINARDQSPAASIFGKENARVGGRQTSFEDAFLKPKVNRQLKSEAKTVIAECKSKLGIIYAGKIGPGETASFVTQSLFELGGGLKTFISPRKQSGIKSPIFQNMKNSYISAKSSKDSIASRATLSHMVNLFGGKDAPDPVEFQMIAQELGISEHLLNDARVLTSEKFPGASAIPSDGVVHCRKTTSDHSLKQLAIFICLPQNSSPAEANKLNVRRGTVLSLTLPPAVLYEDYVVYNSKSDIPLIGLTVFNELLTSGYNFEVQTSEKASCPTCAQCGYGTIDTLQKIIKETTEAFEIAGNADLASLREELLAKVNKVKSFLVSGFQRSCMGGAPGSGSHTTSHCSTYAFGDPQVQALCTECSSHSTPYKSPLDFPDAVFPSVPEVDSPRPGTERQSQVDVEKRRLDPSHRIPTPKVLLYCTMCNNGKKVAEYLGNDLKCEAPVEPFICTQSKSHLSSENHKMDCESCNGPSWLISDISIVLCALQHLVDEEAPTNSVVRREAFRLISINLPFWRYTLELARINMCKMQAHKFRTMAESTYDHDQIRNLKQGEIFLKIDFSSKLWAHIHKETICHAAAGIASNHVFLIYMLMPDEAVHAAFPDLDIDSLIKSHNPSIVGGIVSFFIDIFSADTEQDSDKVFCEESAAYNFIHGMFPWVTSVIRSTDNAGAYHCSNAVQRMVFCLRGDEELVRHDSFSGDSITNVRGADLTESSSSVDVDAMHVDMTTDTAVISPVDIAPPRISCKAIHFKAEGEGKDRVDSEGSFVKKILSRACNQGKDMNTALEMCQMCNLRPDRWSIYAMSDYMKSKIAQFDSNPIAGISDYHLIEKVYADPSRRVVIGVRAFKVSGYGKGVFFSVENLAGLQKAVAPMQAQSLLLDGQPARLFIPPPASISLFASLSENESTPPLTPLPKARDVKAIVTHEEAKLVESAKSEKKRVAAAEKSRVRNEQAAASDASFESARGGEASFICKGHPMCGLSFQTQTWLDKHQNTVGVHNNLASKPTAGKVDRFVELVHSVLRGSSDYYAPGSVLQRVDQHASKAGSAITDAHAESFSLAARRNKWIVEITGLLSDNLSPLEFRQISISDTPAVYEVFNLTPGGPLDLSLKVYSGMIFDKFVRTDDGSYTLFLIRPAPMPYLHGWAIGGHDPCANFNMLSSLTLDTPRRADSTKFLTDIFNEDQKVRPYDAMLRHQVAFPAPWHWWPETSVKSLFSKLYKATKISGRESSAESTEISDQFSAFKIEGLKTCCRVRGLGVGGTKPILLIRLRTYESSIFTADATQSLENASNNVIAEFDAEATDEIDGKDDYFNSLDELEEDEQNVDRSSSILSVKRLCDDQES